jgi:hypothetical protein
MAVAHRLDRRLDDMRRRLEVGLADSKVDHVHAFLRQFVGAGEDLESRFSAQAGHGIDELRHLFSPINRSLVWAPGAAQYAALSSGECHA